MNRVLIVDDNTDNLYLLRKLLEGYGYEVEEARHGAEALEKSSRGPPDVVISDLLMPTMDGYTLLRHWRADDRLKSIPFIVYTATYTEPRDERLALDLGADAFILKPMEPELLTARVGEVLAGTGAANPTRAAQGPPAESVLLKEYNDVLIHKLEKKAAQLEQSNRALVVEMAAREKIDTALRISEERYRTLISAATAIVWSSPASGAFDSDQAAWTEFTGQTVEEHRGWGWLNVIHPEDREKSAEAWALAVQAGSSYEMEHRLRRKDGEFRQMSVRAVPILDPNGEIREWIGAHTDVTDQRRAEADLLLRERAIQAANQGLVITDSAQSDAPIVYVSPGFNRIAGYASQEVMGRNCRFLQGKDTDRGAVAQLRQAIRLGQTCTVEILNYRKDGSSFWNELSLSPIRDQQGRVSNFVGVMTDVTARRNLEEQFRQVQKMEAVGQLAGGIAHDFNNLISIINGYSEVLLESLPPHDANREFINEILKAGERSAGLTRQLLAFSRKQILSPRVLDLNVVVGDTEKMLRRLIEENIRLVTTLAPGLWAVQTDPGQIEQILMNLVVNARDAMPHGGQLTIETQNVELDDDYTAGHVDARSGQHVLLSVTDTGSGMSPEVKAKIFEPFYTTKAPGQGTGLGLTTVYGIAKQCGGHVAVYSEVGVGTTFKIYLPRVLQPSELSPEASKSATPPRGTETILLVEDEDGIRMLTRRMLAGLGYTVLDACDGSDALGLAEKHGGTIHLLITDVVMPGLSGPQVAAGLMHQHPETRVLFVSGYTDDAVVRHGILHENVPYLPKPFTSLALAFKVREVLDHSAVANS